MNKIALTFDVDWAKDEIVQDVVDSLTRFEVKATFFATHDSELLHALDKERFEVGIHPNFNRGGHFNTIIEELKALYPDAIGVRSHALFQSSDILRLFVGNGLKYDVNTFIPFREGLYPFTRLNTFVCIPFYWEDDAHYRAALPFDLHTLRIGRHGLKVYNFHPIHIFMNTRSTEHYEEYQQFHGEPNRLRKFVNEGSGVRTLFLLLLEYLRSTAIDTFTCAEIYQEYIHSYMSRD